MGELAWVTVAAAVKDRVMVFSHPLYAGFVAKQQTGIKHQAMRFEYRITPSFEARSRQCVDSVGRFRISYRIYKFLPQNFS